MRTSITNSIKRLNDQWLDTMSVNVINKLDRTLMCRSVTRPGLLECNIDRGLLELCEEARYFEMLGFGVPVHISQIYNKYTTIRLVYESVLCVVLEFNKIIGSLSDKERVLFKALIQNCERRIMPGIYKLTWGSDMIDAFIAECVKETGQVSSGSVNKIKLPKYNCSFFQLQEFLDVYKKVNLGIVKACEKICDTPIVRIAVTNSILLEDLKNLIKTYRKKSTKELLNLYNNVVKLILVVYTGFEPYLDHVSAKIPEELIMF